MITVISTGLHAATRRLCEASVRAQAVKAQHLYIEAGDQNPPRTVLENIRDAIGRLPEDEIVAWVDGDDFLAHDRALTRIEAMHKAGAWVTYGSYMTSDGEKGICQPYVRNDYRREPWYASHLKTFRAGLFHRLTREDLQHDGEWIPMASDVAVMLPLMELAGPARVMFCEDVLYIYHHRSSHHATSDDAGRREEMEWAAKIRAKPRKEII